jgi:hypothetical protein
MDIAQNGFLILNGKAFILVGATKRALVMRAAKCDLQKDA